MDLAEIQKQAKQAVSEIVEASGIKAGQFFVVGCSSSEVLGEAIGTNTSTDVAEAFTRGSMKFWRKSGSSWPPSAAST